MRTDEREGGWRWRVTGVLVLSAALLAGCQAKGPEVMHVVVCRLKEPGDEAGRRALIEESYRLASIPGLKRVSAGKPLESTKTRPFVDSTYDVLVVMTFEDERALRAYENHPRHRQAVENVLKPLAGQVIIYDAAEAARASEGR